MWLTNEQERCLDRSMTQGEQWVMIADDFKPGGRAYKALFQMDEDILRAEFETKMNKASSEFEESIKVWRSKNAEVATAALTQATTTRH